MFKCTAEGFAELLEREGVSPAPYMARNQWVALAAFNTLEPAELRQCLRTSYELVWNKLPRKTQQSLQDRAKVKAARKPR